LTGHQEITTAGGTFLCKRYNMQSFMKFEFGSFSKNNYKQAMIRADCFMEIASTVRNRIIVSNKRELCPTEREKE
jgi:hypothetical protein